MPSSNFYQPKCFEEGCPPLAFMNYYLLLFLLLPNIEDTWYSTLEQRQLQSFKKH